MASATTTSRSQCLALNLCCMVSLVLAQFGDHFIYHGFRGARLQMLNSTAKILPDGRLQLTNTSQKQVGHAFYNLPFDFSNSMSFSTEFVFSISPNANANDSGHGIAFAISPSMDFFRYASSGGLFGLFNSSQNGNAFNNVLAIEFDTLNSGEWDDMDGNHVGIDLNSVISIEVAPAGYLSDKKGKNISLVLASGKPIQAWVDYDEDEMLLNVTMAPLRIPKPSRPLLSRHINLKKTFVAAMYTGFTASTGAIRASDQYILGWSFNKNGKAKSLNISELPLPPPLPPPPSNPKPQAWVVIIVSVCLVAFVITISAYGYIYWKEKYAEVLEDWEKDYGPQRFSYRSLHKATKGFKESELLGVGGFGKVYKGNHHSEGLIAVKRVSHNAEQGMQEFVAEIISMGRLRHRNLVPLLGYCRRKVELLLVYEYMPNGSLDGFLFGKRDPKLDWRQRFRIIKGVASSLLYLHEEWEQVVLHRDVKASNILLDGDLNGRLGDFGFARFHDRGTNLQATRVVGTVGYMAPELSTIGVATTNTDVFAFGAFMLEVICGRRPIDPEKPQNEIILMKWLVECGTRGSLLDTIDPELQQDYNIEEAELILKLGLLCSQSDPEFRPSMREIMNYLEKNSVLPNIEIHCMSIGASRISSTEGSATTLTFPSSANFSFDTYTVMFQGR